MSTTQDLCWLSAVDLAGAAEGIKNAVESVKNLSAQDAQDEVYREFRLDLCRTCQKAFLKATLVR